MYFYYIMSYSNGLLPSTSTSTNEPQRGLPGIGFKLTADGNFDINGKLLTNVAGPANGDDATNKSYVDTENAKQNIAIADKASKSDLNSKLNIDGSNSMTSDLNLNNNKVINISGGTNNGDAVNYGQLLSHSSNNHQNNYHLQKSFTFYKNFGDKAQLNIQNINITNHNHHDLLVVKKEGSDPGFHGEAWVSLKMTNDLPAGDYTVIFETFSANIVSASNITFLNNETLLQQVRGDANYKIITFSHDYQTTYSKSYIQFTTNGNARDITFEIRYYGSSYNNSNLNFLFYSRVVAGRIGYAFNHKIFDIDDVQLNNQILYFEDVNLNGNKIKNIAHPTEDEDGANKKYVDDEIAKLPHSDNSTLKFDGSRAMTGTLNLGGQRVNIKEFVEDDSSQAASDAQKYDVVNWGKIHEIRGDLKREINAVEYEALNRINPDPMEDDIDMANHKIINVADPTNNQDVAHKKYVDDRIKAIPGGDTSDLLKLDGSRVMTGNLQMGDNFITGLEDPNPSDSDYAASVNFVNKTIDDRLKYSVQSSDISNAFQYVMDDPAGQFYDEDDIKGIKKTDKNFHKINKETYEMQLLLDSRRYYSSRLGINMYILPNGEYSLVYELYYPNTINSSTVQISAVSSVETVSKVTTNVFNNHTRSIIHLHKYNNVAPNRLMIDMVLKNKAGISYVNKLTIFVIVYGVSGYVNNVHTSVWDRLFEVTNNSIKFEATIDMDNKQINNLADGAHGSDAVNVTQLINMTTTTNTEISKVNTNLQNSISNLKKQINNQINNAIAEHGYQNSLICLFYLDNNQFNNGDKISVLPDKKSFMPIHNANQSVESRKPTADDDLNFSYMNYRAQQCLIVNYNLNNKNNLNVFIVFRILDSPGARLNGIFGNYNGGNDRYIAVLHNVTPKQLRIGYGNRRLDLSSFPSKANPLTLNFSVLSVHYNTPDENNSSVYCNGKYVINFTRETSTGENTFSIGSISSDPTNNTSGKHIAYFSLHHGRFSTIDIKRQHKYLCERYRIDHNPISVP